jgi:hypothetical protein
VGTEVNNRKVILISVTILVPLVLAFFVIIAVIEPKETEKEEPEITVSVPQKLQDTTPGHIAGVLERPTVVNITNLGNSSNETE